MLLSSSSRDDAHYPFGKGVCVKESDEKFFEQEMKSGCKVVFYGTYESDGDFGQFSKIICEMRFTAEQRELFDDDDDEIAYYEKFEAILKANDEELISVDFDVIEEN